MDDLNKEEFLNWLKAIIGLNHLKSAIVGPVDEAMKTFYEAILKQVKCSTFPNCAGDNPCKECLKVMQKEIASNTRFKPLPLKDSRLISCSRDYWEIAKCYTTSPDVDTCGRGPESTDCAGILSIIINTKNVTEALDIDKRIKINGNTDPVAEVWSNN